MTSPSPRAWTIARMSLTFTLDLAAAGLSGLDPLEALLVMAVNQANIAPLTRDPAARQAYGALEHAAPDTARRPVSINAIANSLGVPFETTRRRLRRLESIGVCVITPGVGVVVPEAYLTSPPYLESVMAAAGRLLRFYGDLRANDLLDPLPPPNYAIDDGVPLRGAARLLADYLLRAVETMTRQTGDVARALALLAVIDASLEEAPWPPTLPLSAIPLKSARVTELARRVRLPGETVRRHIAALVDTGFAERAARGVILARDVPTRPAFHALVEDHAASVQRLFAGLAERGVVAAWEQMAAANAVAARAGAT